jgi:hypothetical protein
MFIDGAIVVGGALDEEFEVYSFAELQTKIAEVAAQAATDGLPTQVYALFHDHEPGIECECIQYLQDHHPHCTFNISEENLASREG